MAPGSHKKLETDDSSTLSLSAGVYAFEEIKIGRDSVINIDLAGGHCRWTWPRNWRRKSASG